LLGFYNIQLFFDLISIFKFNIEFFKGNFNINYNKDSFVANINKIFVDGF